MACLSWCMCVFCVCERQPREREHTHKRIVTDRECRWRLPFDVPSQHKKQAHYPNPLKAQTLVHTPSYTKQAAGEGVSPPFASPFPLSSLQPPLQPPSLSSRSHATKQPRKQPWATNSPRNTTRTRSTPPRGGMSAFGKSTKPRSRVLANPYVHLSLAPPSLPPSFHAVVTCVLQPYCIHSAYLPVILTLLLTLPPSLPPLLLGLCLCLRPGRLQGLAKK